MQGRRMEYGLRCINCGLTGSEVVVQGENTEPFRIFHGFETLSGDEREPVCPDCGDTAVERMPTGADELV